MDGRFSVAEHSSTRSNGVFLHVGTVVANAENPKHGGVFVGAFKDLEGN